MNPSICPSDIAIKVENLGKRYEIYDKPQDRLRQSPWRGRRRFVTTHVTPGRFPKDFGSGISEPYGPVTIRRPESRLSEGLPLDCGLRRNDGREQLRRFYDFGAE
jgi:hypothetical protein